MKANNLSKITASVLAVLLIAGCSSDFNRNISTEMSSQTNSIKYIGNSISTEPTQSDNSSYEEITQPAKDPKVYYIGDFDNFEKAGEKLQKDILDFGVNAKVYLHEVHDCYILQANEALEGLDIFSEGGLVNTTVESADDKSAEHNEAEAIREIIYPTEQTVIIGEDEEKIKYVKDWMTSPKAEKLGNRSYFSEKLNSYVKLYFGEYTENNHEVGISFAVIEQENAAYTLAFNRNDFESIEDFETNAKKII